ncbi:MAG: lipocalin family protein [Saprospiraceae bacterium]|nr:lipocalin family protein [Saprospiraceae bacterium]
MKNAILNLAAFLMLASAFGACKKEITFKDQLVGQWKSVQVNVGDTDATTSYAFDLNLESSLEFDLDVTSVVPFTGTVTQSYSGDWEENEDKKDVTLRYSNGDEKTWDVISISETLMTAELIENNIRYQVKFERQ